jgi:hypothetical protein
MGYVRPRDVTNVSTARNDVLCGSALIMTSCYSRGIVGSCVFLWVFPEAISRGRTGQANQSRVWRSLKSVLSLQLAVGRETRQRSSQTIAPVETWEAEEYPFFKSLHRNVESSREIDASLRGRSRGISTFERHYPATR